MIDVSWSNLKISSKRSYREDLNAIEEAEGYKRLIDEFSYDQEQVAKFIGKSRSHIANSLRLLTLPQEVSNLVKENKISPGHAKILVGLENCLLISKKIISKKNKWMGRFLAERI